MGFNAFILFSELLMILYIWTLFQSHHSVDAKQNKTKSAAMSLSSLPGHESFSMTLFAPCKQSNSDGVRKCFFLRGLLGAIGSVVGNEVFKVFNIAGDKAEESCLGCDYTFELKAIPDYCFPYDGCRFA